LARRTDVFCFLEIVMKLFVGNLSWNATEETLKPLFEAFGKVVSVRIVTDPYTGRSKGFGFVEMEDEASGDEAVRQLNDSPFLNRPLRVSRARQEQGGNGGPRQSRPSGFSSHRGGSEDRRPPRRSHYEERGESRE
jgi:RNA recognition motif-containing protein